METQGLELPGVPGEGGRSSPHFREERAAESSVPGDDTDLADDTQL